MKQGAFFFAIGVLLSTLVFKVYAAGNFSAKSWRDVDTGKFNAKIEAAHSANKTWVSKPELYVHYLLGMDETKEVLFEMVANRMESPSEYTIKLKRHKMLDDSVRGDINILTLTKSTKGYWQVKSAKRASSCWKDKSGNYYGKPC